MPLHGMQSSLYHVTTVNNQAYEWWLVIETPPEVWFGLDCSQAGWRWSPMCCRRSILLDIIFIHFLSRGIPIFPRTVHHDCLSSMDLTTFSILWSHSIVWNNCIFEGSWLFRINIVRFSVSSSFWHLILDLWLLEVIY